MLGLIGFMVERSLDPSACLPRACFGVNEIITSVMMSFIGINFANCSSGSGGQREASADGGGASRVAPRGRDHHPYVGILVAMVAVIAVWYFLSRTSTGLRMTILGANPVRRCTRVMSGGSS